MSPCPSRYAEYRTELGGLIRYLGYCTSESVAADEIGESRQQHQNEQREGKRTAGARTGAISGFRGIFTECSTGVRGCGCAVMAGLSGTVEPTTAGNLRVLRILSEFALSLSPIPPEGGGA